MAETTLYYKGTAQKVPEMDASFYLGLPGYSKAAPTTSPTLTPTTTNLSSMNPVDAVKKLQAESTGLQTNPNYVAEQNPSFTKNNGIITSDQTGKQLSTTGQPMENKVEKFEEKPQDKPPLSQTSDAERAKIKAAGIEEQKKLLEAGGTKPTFDPVVKFDELRKVEGIVKDDEELSAIQNEQRIAQEEMRQYKQTAGTSSGTQQGYLGAVSEAERNLNFRLEGAAIREQAVIGRINTKNAYINQAMQFAGQKYDIARKEYEDNFNTNLKAVELYNQQLDNDQKDALTTVTTISNLLKDKTIEKMPASLSSALDTAALKLGYDAGTFQAVIQATPDEKILAPISIDTATGKDLYFYTQGTDGTPHLKQVQSVLGNGQDRSQVINIAQKYPDAGILTTDTIEQANEKVVSKSKVYKQATRLASGGTSAETSGVVPSSGIDFDNPEAVAKLPISDITKAIVSGLGSVKELTPTDKSKVISELYKIGFDPKQHLFDKLQNLASLYDGLPSSMKGLVQGYIPSAWNAKASEFESARTLLVRKIARLNDVGVLSDQDVASYNAALPARTDRNTEVVKAKVKGIVGVEGVKNNAKTGDPLGIR